MGIEGALRPRLRGAGSLLSLSIPHNSHKYIKL